MAFTPNASFLLFSFFWARVPDQFQRVFKAICVSQKGSVTSRYYGSKIFGSQQKGAQVTTTATATRTAKSNKFILVKQQLCTCITLFCTCFSRRCTTATWNFLISRASLGSRWTQHKTFLCPFLNSDTVLSDSIQKISPTFDKLNEIEDRWSLKECEFAF